MINHIALRPLVVAAALWLTACGSDGFGPSGPATSGHRPALRGAAEDVIAVLDADADTYVRSGSPNINEGASPVLRLQATGNNRVLVAFEQSSIEDALDGGTLVQAILELEIVENADNWGPTGRPISLHRMLRSWTEGNGKNAELPGPQQYRGDGPGATWNCATDSNVANQVKDCATDSWAMGNAAQYPWVADPTATTAITSGQTGTIQFDVTADVAAFLGGASNDGWILKKVNEGASGKVEFHSREAGTPTLILTITPPEPPAPAGLLFYLHNRSTQPSANTTSLANLPMDGTVPTRTGSLPNYDTDRDAFGGRLIQKNSESATQSDLGKYQNWVSPAFGAGFEIAKATIGEVRIWTAMKDNKSDKTGRVRVYIRDCPGTPQTGCVLIGQADYTRPQSGPFSEAVISVPWTFAPATYTVAAGRFLEVKVVVRDSADDDMWFGYDTDAMQAAFRYQP